MKNPKFIEENIYHIYNRGVEKRKIFLDKTDHLILIHNLYEFNNSNPVPHLKDLSKNKFITLKRKKVKATRKPLVEILAFVMMPNHYHLILKQKLDSGISKYMQKLGTGYTMYFNKKYERVGSLFQGKFKAKMIEKDNHFLYLPYYIHLNPIKLIDKNKSSSEKWKFLKNYRWSSLLDYIGEKNFPSITQRNFLLEKIGNSKEHKKEMKKWIEEDFEKIKSKIY